VDTEAAVETETLAEDVVEAGTEGEEIASEEASEESEQAATDDDPEVEVTPAPKAAKKAGKAKKPPEPEDPKAKLARLKADPEVQRLIKAEADKRLRRRSPPTATLRWTVRASSTTHARCWPKRCWSWRCRWALKPRCEKVWPKSTAVRSVLNGVCPSPPTCPCSASRGSWRG
jgi:hypothetical protein